MKIPTCSARDDPLNGKKAHQHLHREALLKPERHLLHHGGIISAHVLNALIAGVCLSSAKDAWSAAAADTLDVFKDSSE